MKKIVFKGFHISLPITIPWKFKSYQWKIEPIKWKYDLKDLDQYDWNKLCGLKEQWNTHNVSLMLGWRWLKDRFEICAYQHDCELFSNHKDNRFIWSQGIKTIKSEFPFEVFIENLDHKWLLVVMQGNKIVLTQSFQKSTKKKRCFRIEHYFGGNRKAPTNIIFKFNKK